MSFLSSTASALILDFTKLGQQTVQFDRVGVSFLFCNIHPEMSAAVVAVNTPYFGMSIASSRAHRADVTAGPVRHPKVRSVDGDYGSAHFRVNIAEQKLTPTRSNCTVLLDQLRKIKIKALAVEERKDIVEKRISVRKLHSRARLNHQNMRIEALSSCAIFGAEWAGVSRRPIRRCADRCKPDDTFEDPLHSGLSRSS